MVVLISVVFKNKPGMGEGAKFYVSLIILSSNRIKRVSSILFGGGERQNTKGDKLCKTKRESCLAWSPNRHRDFSLKVSVLKMRILLNFVTKLTRRT